MSAEFSKDLDKALAAQILKNVSTGIALFSPDDHFMRWCNATFKSKRGLVELENPRQK